MEKTDLYTEGDTGASTTHFILRIARTALALYWGELETREANLTIPVKELSVR